MISRDVQSVLCGGSDAAPDMNVDRDPDVNCSYCSICQLPTEDNEASRCEVCAKNVCHKCSFVHSLGSCSGALRKNCFPSSVELESQKVVHDDERPYECTVCGECFKWKDHLSGHMWVHSNQQPYKCTVCDKCFKWKDHLSGRMWVHSNQQPYKCTVCDKCFKWKDHLSGHMRIHSNQRPYKCICTVCDKCFAQKSHLASHMRVVHSDDPPYIIMYRV